MEYEKLRIRRKQIGWRIFEALTNHSPPGVIRVDTPDDLGAVGVCYDESDKKEYILITQEDC